MKRSCPAGNSQKRKAMKVASSVKAASAKRPQPTKTSRVRIIAEAPSSSAITSHREQRVPARVRNGPSRPMAPGKSQSASTRPP